MRVLNLHGLAMSGLPLGVGCTTCGHRALVEAAKVGARWLPDVTNRLGSALPAT